MLFRDSGCFERVSLLQHIERAPWSLIEKQGSYLLPILLSITFVHLTSLNVLFSPTEAYVNAYMRTYVYKCTHKHLHYCEKYLKTCVSFLALIVPFSMFCFNACDLAKNLQMTRWPQLPSLDHHQNQLLMNRRQKVGKMCRFVFY